ncbi:nose resistant to fluoxetine protein 6-like [Zophobas morio]|uniref:nose resistant to fluoxetine protein 6-like n=1 Tax=Zophobas morio TaxID=2755281 RepID=UPI00308357B4
MKTALVLFLVISLAQCKVPLSLVKFQAIKFVTASNISEECAADLSLLISDLFGLKMWALKMFDATGKINAGMSNGNLHFFGDFDLCLSIKENTKTRTIEGKYCTALMRVNDEILDQAKRLLNLQYLKLVYSAINIQIAFNDMQNLTGLVGICVPKSCSLDDLEILARHVERKLKLPINLSFLEEMCTYKNQPTNINTLDLITYCGLILMGLLLVGSTIYDVYLHGCGVFRIFSMYTNLKKLLDKAETKKLSCVSGIKVISSLWIILVHTVLIASLIAKNLVYAFAEWRYTPIGMVMWSGPYGVDTFFALSGLLVTYTYLKNCQNSSIGLLEFYSKRLLRLMPTMTGLITIQSSLLKLFLDGPNGQILLKISVDNCRDNWPSMLFFTFNFMKDAKCASNHIWYLSSDTQMYFLAPIFLFFITKHPRKVIAGMTVTFLFAVGYSVAVTFIKKLGFTIFDWNCDFEHYLSLSTIHRLPSWLTGVFCGYLLQFKNVKIPRNLNNCLLFVSLLSMILLILNQVSLLDEEYNVYRAALWNGLARPMWSLALCYIIFSCASGHGGIINSFLSHYVFRVLSELTFSIYLLHAVFVAGILGNTRQSVFFNNRQILLNLVEVYMYCLPASLLAYLAFEAPFLSLKDYTSRRRKVMAEKSS